jgi:hypothetical protein
VPVYNLGLYREVRGKRESYTSRVEIGDLARVVTELKCALLVCDRLSRPALVREERDYCSRRSL